MIQPTHSSRRILLPARAWFIYLSLCVALVLNLASFGRLPGYPDWLALVLTLRDIERGRPVNVLGSFAGGVKMIPADFYLKCAAAWKILLWGLCFILPGLYKAVLYSLAKYSLIEENKKGFDALDASHSLLKGKFVHYLDYIFFVFLIVFYVFMVQKLLMDHVYNFFMFREIHGVLRWIENFEIVCAGWGHVFIVIFFHRLYLRLKNAA